MGIFGSIVDIVRKPIRGIGRIARGKFREGLSDIGAGAKAAAPALALTGVGAPLALGIGAGGGALEGATKKGAGFGDVIGGAAGGAAGAGTGLALRGIGSRLLGGAGEAIDPFARAASGAGNAASVAAPAAAAGAGAGGGVGGALRGIGSFVKDNPEVATQIAGTAANAYGAHQEGEALDRLARLREEEQRRAWERQENADPVIQRILQELLMAPSPN